MRNSPTLRRLRTTAGRLTTLARTRCGLLPKILFGIQQSNIILPRKQVYMILAGPKRQVPGDGTEAGCGAAALGSFDLESGLQQDVGSGGDDVASDGIRLKRMLSSRAGLPKSAPFPGGWTPTRRAPPSTAQGRGRCRRYVRRKPKHNRVSPLPEPPPHPAPGRA